MAEQYQKIATVFLGALFLVALCVVLVVMQSVVLPLVLAVLLSYIFKPVVLFLRARHVPNALALIAVFFVIAGLFFGFGSILYSSVNAFVEAFPKYQHRLTLLLHESSNLLARLADEAGVKLGSITLTDVIDVSAIGSIVTKSAGSFVSLLSNLVLVLLFMFFILAGSGDIIVKLRTAVSMKHSETLAVMIENIDAKVRSYLITKTLISLLTGTVTTVILLILGVDFALLWGFLTFLLNFIPTVGSVVSVFFPFLFSFLQFETFTIPVLTLVLLIVAQNAIGNVLEPRFMAHSLNLSPLLVLVALLFWGWIWGVWGMILSVPITSTIKIVCENIDSLKPVAALMSGRVHKDNVPKK